MVKREVLRGATIAVAATIMATSMSLASPITVEAKVRSAGKNITAFVEIPEYVDDDYIPPAGYKVVDNKVVPIDGGAPINNTSIPASTTAATPVSTSDFNLNATWTYLENSANNPVPVMVEQSPNVWVVAMYQGTSAVFGVNQNYGAGMVPTVVSAATGCAAAAGNEAGIIIAANTVGTDMLAYQLVNPQAGAPATATTITIAVSVVPAAPGTGNGVMTNVGAVPTTPAVTAGSTATTAKTDREKEDEFIRLLNAERAALGLKPLTRDSDLCSFAMNSIMPQIKKDFKHVSNTHSVNNKPCYEELHRGSYNAKGALSSFKASWGHWVDMIDKHADIIGVAYSGGYWVVLPGYHSSDYRVDCSIQDEVEEFGEDDYSWVETY